MIGGEKSFRNRLFLFRDREYLSFTNGKPRAMVAQSWFNGYKKIHPPAGGWIRYQHLVPCVPCLEHFHNNAFCTEYFTGSIDQLHDVNAIGFQTKVYIGL